MEHSVSSSQLAGRIDFHWWGPAEYAQTANPRVRQMLESYAKAETARQQ
jgi:hypothetical protein